MQDQENNIAHLLKKLINGGSKKEYVFFFKQYHEADIAEGLSLLKIKDRIKFFQFLSPAIAVDVLEELDVDKQKEIISEFKLELAAKFIEEMEPDDAVDLIEEISESDEHQAAELLNALPTKEKSELENLLSYEDSVAGSLMTSNYLSIPENLSVTEALDVIKTLNPPESELSFYIFIVSKTNKLIGYTTLRDLVFCKDNEKVYDLRHEHHIFVDQFDDRESVANLFQKYDMSVIPVVDDNQHLLGAITVDDVVDVVIEEANEDIFKLSGTTVDSKPDFLLAEIIKPVFSRLPWLFIYIIGGVFASYIINKYSLHFDASLFPLALSLSFVPLLMGLGGNVGNQSSAIIVRGIAMGDNRLNKSLIVVGHELLVSLLIGMVVSCFLLCINIIFYDFSFLFSMIVSISLVINIVVAGLIGTILPILFNKCNIDPAVASAPFISTTLDIVGQIIYFLITIYSITTFVG